jgi:hypothetical protein
MVAKTYLVVIGIVLAISVTLPQSFSQNSTTDSRHQAPSDCNAPQLAEPEAQWTRLLAEVLPVSTITERVSTSSSQRESAVKPPVSGNCEAEFVSTNPRTAKGGEWVLTGICATSTIGDACIVGRAAGDSCPIGARVMNLGHVCISNIPVDEARGCLIFSPDVE